MVDIKNKMTIAQNTYLFGAAATNVMAAPSRQAVRTEDGAARKPYGLCGKWGVMMRFLVRWGGPWGAGEQAYGGWMMMASCHGAICNARYLRSMAFLTGNPGENLDFVAVRRGVARLPRRRDFLRWTQYILFIPKGQRGGRVDVMIEIATCQGEALRSVEVEAETDT